MKRMVPGLLLLLPLTAAAEQLVELSAVTELRVEMNAVTDKGVGDWIGVVRVTQNDRGGIVLKPDLRDLAPGLHGFHVHQNPSCAPAMVESKPTAGADGGGHYDPQHVGKHGSPWADGHPGDLPALYVDGNGAATHPVFSPRLSLEELYGRSLMVHEHGDSYTDHPTPMGGSGVPVACGVIGKP